MTPAKLYTTPEVAAKIERSSDTVDIIRARLDIGTKLYGRWLFSNEEVEKIVAAIGTVRMGRPPKKLDAQQTQATENSQ